MQFNFDSTNYCIILSQEGWMSGLNRTPGKRVQSLCSDAGSNPAPSAIRLKVKMNYKFHHSFFYQYLTLVLLKIDKFYLIHFCNER